MVQSKRKSTSSSVKLPTPPPPPPQKCNGPSLRQVHDFYVTHYCVTERVRLVFILLILFFVEGGWVEQ